MIAYKLMRTRKDGTIGPLFINKRQKMEIGGTYAAEDHPTKGYYHRPGWHCLPHPIAPHLKEDIDGRHWMKVIISDFTKEIRPARQGGTWYLANMMTILEYVH